MNTRRDYKRLGKTLVAGATLSVFLLFVAVPRSQADGRGKCQRNMERAEARLDQAIHRYGGNSRQAIDRWHELNAERQRCWNQYHAWWGVQDHRWHDERDWERYDKDRGWHHD
ncbi:MAG TPA: hypothetical protein VMT05_09500 [Terriglobales bacterium]|nr:hypothetical protein [Terriglobales bacterium]